MEDPDTNSLSDSIVYEDYLPLQWESLDSLPDDVQYTRMNENNEQVLRIVSSLEEYVPDSIEEHSQHTPDLARIEFKVNLLMDLMSRFIESSHHFPEKHLVRFSASRLEWFQENQPGFEPGSSIGIELYLNTGYPVPLQLVGSLQSFDQSSKGFHAVMVLRGISENTRDQLEKMIFRHHRRSIAHQRQSKV